MPRERDWMDYMQLASSFTQNLQLTRVNKTLGGLQELEQEKVDKEKRIDRFKAALFDLEDDLARLAQEPDSNPRKRLYRLAGTQALLDNLRSTAELTFEGMDRWRGVRSRLDSLLKEAETAVPDVADIKLAFQHMASLNELEDAIRYYQSLEEIVRLRREQDMFKWSQERERGQAGKLFVWAVVVFIGGWAMAALMGSGAIGGLTLLITLILVFLWGRTAFGQSAFINRNLITSLQRQMDALETGMELPPEIMKTLYAEPVAGMKDPTPAKLHAVYQQRVEFVNRVMEAQLKVKPLAEITRSLTPA